MLTNEQVYHNTDIILISNTIAQEGDIIRLSSVTENDVLNLFLRQDIKALLISIFLKKNKDLLYINKLLGDKETVTAVTHAINSKKMKSCQLY